MNIIDNILLMDQWGIPHPDWEFVKSSADLKRHHQIKDYCGWTIRVAWTGSRFKKPLYVNWLAKEKVPQEIDRLAKQAKKDYLIITYPSWIPQKSGTLLIENNRIVIESCQGQITRLMREGQCDAGYQLGKSGRIQDSWGNQNFLANREKKQIISALAKIPEKNIILEWAFGQQKEFIFYKFESMARAGKALLEKYS